MRGSWLMRAGPKKPGRSSDRSLQDPRPSTLAVRPTGAGTRVAALFYSLIESAKLAEVEPRPYLGQAARREIRNPSTVTLARDLESAKA
jgi:hypothetical protein